MATHVGEECDQARLGLREVGDLSVLSTQTARDIMEGRQKRKGFRQVNDQPSYRNHYPTPELQWSLAQKENLGLGTGCAVARRR
jgi:hypothetical protein